MTAEAEYLQQVRTEWQRALAGRPAPTFEPYLRDGQVRIPVNFADRVRLAGVFLAGGRVAEALETLSEPGHPADRPWIGHDALIIDPGFVRLDGHSANSNVYFRRQLSRLGYSPATLRNIRIFKGFPVNEETGDPVFSVSPYIQPFGPSPSLEQLQLINDLFFHEFREKLVGIAPRVVVTHSLRFTFIEGFCRYLRTLPPGPETRLVLAAVETDVLDKNHPMHDAVCEIYRRAIEHLNSLESARVLFLVEHPAFRELLVAQGLERSRLLDAPYVAASLIATTAEREDGPAHAPTIGFVGQTRQERGTAIIPEIVERTLSEIPNGRWVLQINQETLGREAGESAVRTLQRLAAHERVTFVQPALLLPDYERLLQSVDVMVLPYDRRYRHSGSGIAMESLRCGHVQVVPRGSSMEQVIRAAGGAPVTFRNNGVREVTAAVTEAVRRFEQLAPVNRRAAARLQGKDAVTQTIESFIGPRGS